MSEQEDTSRETESKIGVLGSREEDNHYIVSVRWKDGLESESHFPVRGFEVVNPATGKHLGFIRGEKAVDILKKHAAEFSRGEFSWQGFV
ncbi:MAG: hypothetical protein Q7S09_03380 [bacterium]|nr:hypothetical protein [bacterium]